MIIQAIEEKKIVRSGDGEEIRDYIHIDDAANVSVDLLNSKEKLEHVMITGNQTLKIKNIVNMISEMMDDDIKVSYTNTGSPDHYVITPYNFKPNVARKYNIDYTHDLGQGILDCIYDLYQQLKK